MKKKNGFIAISLIYSFFLCFVLIMMGLLANYTHSKLLLDKINEPLVFEKEIGAKDVILNAIAKNNSCTINDDENTCLDIEYDEDEDITTYTINEKITIYIKINNSLFSLTKFDSNNTIYYSNDISKINAKIKSGAGSQENPFIIS